MLREVVISVLGLFHPEELRIAPAGGAPLDIVCSSERTRLEGTAKKLALKAGCVAQGSFTLSVPGRIERTFTGALQIEPGLTALVTMDLETAVAATVAAELPRTTPPAALEAQAVAVRFPTDAMHTAPFATPRIASTFEDPYPPAIPRPKRREPPGDLSWTTGPTS
jgi:hypothetical protein